MFALARVKHVSRDRVFPEASLFTEIFHIIYQRMTRAESPRSDPEFFKNQ
jgi:hypothetical protein